MLDHLIAGMRDAGAEVETILLSKETVNFCTGCFSCWTRTPGICIHKDDMTSRIFPKWLASDLVVYATPLYHYTMNAEMKAFVERTLPVLHPFFKIHEGRTQHPTRYDPPNAVWLSVAGFPEPSIFEPLSAYLKFVYGRRLLAELYRPAAETLLTPFYHDARETIGRAVRLAGRQLIQSGTVASETADIIVQPYEKPDRLAAAGNLFWKTCIREGVTPKQFARRKMIPRPDSIETFMMVLRMGFNPNRAAGLKAVIQFDFEGEVSGSCFLTIDDGAMSAETGTAENPDMTVSSPFEVWMDIMTGKADGQEMFLRKRYRVSGDFQLLLKMKALFGRSA